MPKWSLAGVWLVLLAGSAHAASNTDLALFGKDPGGDRAFACYARHYDQLHLKLHPKQNVTDMTLLVDSSVDDQRYYTLTVGVGFRKVADQMMVSGSCNGTIDDQALLHCGVDCDGGQIDVRLKDENRILVDIPFGARTWNPNAPLDAEPDAGVPPEAAFGPDDKTFRLTRAPLSRCINLINDDDKSLLAAAQ